jgi:hypothetical protein
MEKKTFLNKQQELKKNIKIAINISLIDKVII